MNTGQSGASRDACKLMATYNYSETATSGSLFNENGYLTLVP